MSALQDTGSLPRLKHLDIRDHVQRDYGRPQVASLLEMLWWRTGHRVLESFEMLLWTSAHVPSADVMAESRALAEAGLQIRVVRDVVLGCSRALKLISQRHSCIQ
jgi:hypothetical protein